MLAQAFGHHLLLVSLSGRDPMVAEVARAVPGKATAGGFTVGDNPENVVVTTSDLAFQLLDGAAAAAQAADLQTLHAEVFADPPYDQADDAALFADRFRVQRRQPGFVLAEARRGGYLVGYAAGMPLRSATSWWRDLTTPLPADVTAEYPGRTFAVIDLLVRAAWRRQGIGRALHDLLLQGRREERATLTVLPAATAAQSAFHNWGWRRVARTRATNAGSPILDVLVMTLPTSHRIA